MKDKQEIISSDEFNRRVNTGQYDVRDGHTHTGNLSPEYKSLLEDDNKPVQPSLFPDGQIPQKEKIIDPTASDTFTEVIKLLRQRYKEEKVVIIPGNAPSLKNSKEIGFYLTKNSECCGKPIIGTGKFTTCSKCKNSCKRMRRNILVPSKTVKKYVKATENDWIVNRIKFHSLIKRMSPPYFVGIYFIRASRHNFDLINSCQIICDLMVENKYIDDDDADNIVPVFLGYHHDPKRACTAMVILDREQYINNLIKMI